MIRLVVGIVGGAVLAIGLLVWVFLGFFGEGADIETGRGGDTLPGKVITIVGAIVFASHWLL